MLAARIAGAVTAFALSTSCLAHPGGLDASGGHTDRRTGTYHSHRGGGGGAAIGNSGYFIPQPGRIGLRSYTYTPRKRVPKLRTTEVRKTVRGTPDEEKGEKLIGFAKRQYSIGKDVVAIRTVRRVTQEYAATPSASEATLLLEGWLQDLPFREWSDKTGKFKVIAKYVHLVTGIVHLLKQEGEKEIKVELKRLSLPDQHYVAELEGI